MTTDDRFERLLVDVLAEVAPTREPDRLVPEILRAARRASLAALARPHQGAPHAQTAISFGPRGRPGQKAARPTITDSEQHGGGPNFHTTVQGSPSFQAPGQARPST